MQKLADSRAVVLHVPIELSQGLPNFSKIRPKLFAFFRGDFQSEESLEEWTWKYSKKAKVAFSRPQKVVNFECLDCNSTVRGSRVNSAASHRRIALEWGLKGQIFLQFLCLFAIEAPPGRPQKWSFFVFLEPFHSTRFRSGNVSFQQQNRTPEFHFSEQNFCFFGRSVLRRQQIPYKTGIKKKLARLL